LKVWASSSATTATEGSYPTGGPDIVAFLCWIVEPGEKRSFLSAGIAAFASSFYAVQRTDCGRIDWRPIGIEHRAMAGTIPARLEAVPVQMAADMAAGRRTKVQLPAFVAIRVNDKVFADLSGMRPGS
jgi:hypothetical protein